MKKKMQQLLTLGITLSLFMGTTFYVQADKISDLQQQQQENQNKLNDVNDSIDDISAQQELIDEEIADLDADHHQRFGGRYPPERSGH